MAEYGDNGRLLPYVCQCGQPHTTRFGRPSCTHHKHDGTPCLKEPLKGGAMCRSHGGTEGKQRAAAEKRLAFAAVRKEAFDSFGGSLDVSPTEAMLAMVREAAWNVAFLRSLVEVLRPQLEDGGPVVIDEEGVTQVPAAWVGAGIAARIDPENFKAEAHVLVRMYDRERDRLVKYAKLCRDAGVEEGRLKVYEEQGRWLTQTLDLVFTELQLTEDQQDRLPTIMRGVIGQLEAAGIG